MIETNAVYTGVYLYDTELESFLILMRRHFLFVRISDDGSKVIRYSYRRRRRHFYRR